jgi:hypothetical protein
MTGFYQNNYSGEPEKDGEIQILYKEDCMAFRRMASASAGKTETAPKETYATAQDVERLLEVAVSGRYSMFIITEDKLSVGNCNKGKCYGLSKEQLEIFEGSLGKRYKEVLARTELLVGKVLIEMLGYKGFEGIETEEAFIRGLLAYATSQQVTDFSNKLRGVYAEIEDLSSIHPFINDVIEFLETIRVSRKAFETKGTSLRMLSND